MSHPAARRARGNQVLSAFGCENSCQHRKTFAVDRISISLINFVGQFWSTLRFPPKYHKTPRFRGQSAGQSTGQSTLGCVFPEVFDRFLYIVDVWTALSKLGQSTLGSDFYRFPNEFQGGLLGCMVAVINYNRIPCSGQSTLWASPWCSPRAVLPSYQAIRDWIKGTPSLN